MNFWKSAKGGAIFNPKIYIADFGNFKQVFLTMKLIQKRNFRVQGMLFSTIVFYYKGWGLIASLEQLVDLSANEKPPFVL